MIREHALPIAALFLAAVAIGMCIPSWLDRRKAAKAAARLAASELRHLAAKEVFWVSLKKLTDAAYDDIDAAADFAAREQEASS